MKNQPDDKQPYNLEAEQSTIANMILDPRSIHDLQKLVSPQDFYLTKHQWIVEAIYALAAQGANPDYVLLCEKLKSQHGDTPELDRLQSVGGYAFVNGLMETVNYTTMPIKNAAIIAGAAAKRGKIKLAQEIAEMAYNANGETPQELHAQTQAMVDVTAPEKKTGTTVYHRDTLDLKARQAKIAARPPLISWPWPGQERFIDFLYRGLTMAVGAETSVGKTIFMENLAEHAARTADVDVLYYHLENPTNEMLHRRICRLGGGVTMQQLRRGYYGPEVRRAEQIANDWIGRIHLVKSWGWTASQIVADAKQKIREGICDLVIVDYFQKMKLDIMRGESEVTCRGRQLEQLATFCVDNETTVVIGSQMNKGSYGQKRKVAGSFRGTGEIAEKSNIAITLDRQIHDGTEPMRGPEGTIIAMPGSRSPETTLRFDKNSGGPTGEVAMRCNAPRFRFDELYTQGEASPLNFPD